MKACLGNGVCVDNMYFDNRHIKHVYFRNKHNGYV